MWSKAIVIGFAMMALQVRAISAYGGLYQSYCSNENTGSDYDGVYDIYNTIGSCFTQCEGGGYAFAVVQYQNCWCSNYAPASTENTSNCNQECPGYGREQCGNSGAGLYGYIPLSNAPSGTAGAASSKAADTSSQPAPVPSPTQEQTSVQPVTSQQTSIQPQTSSQPIPTSAQTTTTLPRASSTVPSSVSYVSRTRVVTQVVTQKETETQSPSVITSYANPASHTTASSGNGATTKHASPSISSTSTPKTNSRATSITTQIRVTTVSGSQVTQTVTSTPRFVAASGVSDTADFQREGLSGGAIAGIVIGTLLGVAALLLGAFLLWRRKKTDDSSSDEDVPAAGARPRRAASMLSRAGLIAGARPQSQNMAEHNHDDPFRDPVTRTNSTRYSMMFGAGLAQGVDPVSSLDGDDDANDGTSSNRHSRPMVYDQRLNPSALFANHDNGSRVSMQDQQDYSRPLGVANPEFRPSFDSR